jgi:hypothetical protein
MATITLNTNDQFSVHWLNEEGISCFLSFRFGTVEVNNLMQCVQV